MHSPYRRTHRVGGERGHPGLNGQGVENHLNPPIPRGTNVASRAGRQETWGWWKSWGEWTGESGVTAVNRWLEACSRRCSAASQAHGKYDAEVLARASAYPGPLGCHSLQPPCGSLWRHDMKDAGLDQEGRNPRLDFPSDITAARHWCARSSRPLLSKHSTSPSKSSCPLPASWSDRTFAAWLDRPRRVTFRMWKMLKEGIKSSEGWDCRCEGCLFKGTHSSPAPAATKELEFCSAIRLVERAYSRHSLHMDSQRWIVLRECLWQQ